MWLFSVEIIDSIVFFLFIAQFNYTVGVGPFIYAPTSMADGEVRDILEMTVRAFSVHCRETDDFEQTRRAQQIMSELCNTRGGQWLCIVGRSGAFSATHNYLQKTQLLAFRYREHDVCVLKLAE